MAEQKPKGQKSLPLILGGLIALASLIFVAVLFLGGSKPVAYTLGDGVLDISTNYGQTVKLSDITAVELKNDLPSNLRRTNGYGLGTVVRGACSSDSGDVTVYIDTAVPPFIYLTTSSGLIILNDETAEKTQVLYDSLLSAIG